MAWGPLQAHGLFLDAVRSHERHTRITADQKLLDDWKTSGCRTLMRVTDDHLPAEPLMPWPDEDRWMFTADPDREDDEDGGDPLNAEVAAHPTLWEDEA